MWVRILISKVFISLKISRGFANKYTILQRFDYWKNDHIKITYISLLSKAPISQSVAYRLCVKNFLDGNNTSIPPIGYIPDNQDPSIIFIASPKNY